MLLRLIDDILDLSKIEAGSIDFTMIDFDMDDFLYEMQIAYEPSMPENINFKVEKSDKHPMILFDRDKLVQLVNNLVANALKFTKSGSITLGYKFHETEFEVYVSDTGIGIREEDCRRVFDRFEKLSSQAPGTGLGLPICKAIVDAAGGRMDVVSTYGEGTTFRLFLPLSLVAPNYWNTVAAQQPVAETVEVKADVDAEEVPATQPQVADRNDIRILVAEDTDSNYLLMENFLKDYQLHRVCSGDEALDKLQDNNFDLILMDMKMPGLDGLDASRIIREIDTTTPIIAVTAYAFEHDRQEIMEAGCNAFLAKPFSQRELLDVVESVLVKETV